MYTLVSELYPDYPDPMPAFQYLGGDYGKGLLESALAQPQQQFQGRYLYRTIYDKAAALFFSLIKNHPLVDGNKRLALTSTVVFLLMNGVGLYAPREEAVAFAVKLAGTGSEVSWEEVSKWLRGHSFPFRGALQQLNNMQLVEELRSLLRLVARLPSLVPPI